MNSRPHLLHSCTTALHSTTLLLMAPEVSTKSSTLFTLGLPAAFFPFDHRIISVLPHSGHLLLLISMCRLILSFWFSYLFGFFRFFFSTLLVRMNTRCL